MNVDHIYSSGLGISFVKKILNYSGNNYVISKLLLDQPLLGNYNQRVCKNLFGELDITL